MSVSGKVDVTSHNRKWNMAAMAKALFYISRGRHSAHELENMLGVPHSSISGYWKKIPQHIKEQGIRDEQQLRDWLNDNELQMTAKKGCQLLTADEEQYLIQWIQFTHTINYHLYPEDIRLLAKEILETRKGTTINCLNKHLEHSYTPIHTFFLQNHD